MSCTLRLTPNTTYETDSSIIKTFELTTLFVAMRLVYLHCLNLADYPELKTKECRFCIVFTSTSGLSLPIVDYKGHENKNDDSVIIMMTVHFFVAVSALHPQPNSNCFIVISY